MEDVKEKIKKELKSLVKKLYGEDIGPDLSHPALEKFGDYSSNIAMAIFSSEKLKAKSEKFKSPLELAQQIASFFNSDLSSFNLERVEVAVPGFINFWISKEYLLSSLVNISEDKIKIFSQKLSGKKIMVEFAQPNTHKEFHIGHLRNITTGESIARLLEFIKADVFRANFQGDIGLHVAKALYGVFHLCHAELVSAPKILDNKIFKEVQAIGSETSGSRDDNLNKRIKFLGEAYVEGSKAYEEDEKAKKEILEINKSLYLKEDKYQDLYKKTRQWSLDYFEEIYKRLGSHFHRLFFESEVFEEGKKIVLENVSRVFKEDQGAIIFDGELYGLHKRVFITKEGNPTYEGKDMGLGFLEYSTFPFDLALHVVGNEQAGYFQVIFKALELIDGKFKNKEKHLSYGMVELKEGKMSSRKGNVLTAEWLLDEVKSKIKEEFKDMDEKTAEMVTIGAVKYSMLKFSTASSIAFSIDESISLEGNSGAYLQYAFARTQSILSKGHSEVKPKNLNRSFASAQDDKMQIEEESLLRVLAKFDEIVVEAGEGFAPNILCAYLYDLAKHFNLFYQKCPILKEGESKEFRIALTSATGNVLKKGLYLLGIEAPGKM